MKYERVEYLSNVFVSVGMLLEGFTVAVPALTEPWLITYTWELVGPILGILAGVLTVVAFILRLKVRRFDKSFLLNILLVASLLLVHFNTYHYWLTLGR